MGAWIETLVIPHLKEYDMSHPTWVRGLKHNKGRYPSSGQNVAPYVGAWIETSSAVARIISLKGRTLRGCVD